MTKEDSLKFLKDLITQIDIQDNCGTSSPYYYCIQDREPHYYPVMNEPSGVLMDSSFYDISGCREFLKEQDSEKDMDFNKYSDSDIFEYLEDYYEATIVEVEERKILKGHFFTKRAAEEHLQANKHHYKNPSLYCEYEKRNPELEKLLSAIRVIVE